MSFLFLFVNSSTIPAFLGNQVVAKADRQIKCIDTERNALLDFKASLQDPFGRHCISAWGTKKEDVNDDDDCCNWRGVSCNNQTGHVVELDLRDCSLAGELSPSLLNLTYLTHLDLWWNLFSGSIPQFLTGLRHLDLSGNAFSGNILKTIGSLTELRYLDLSGNAFSGNILGNILMTIRSLTKLTHLDLSWNSLNGTIPMSVGSLTELRELRLSRNFLNGTIPVSIGSLTKLRELDLSFNSFSGTIPISVGSLTELTELDLSSNFFSGTVLLFVGSLTELRELDLSSNSFGGNIPMTIGSLTKLRSFSLSHNSFSGNIPNSIGSLRELRYLFLSNNTFSGSVPKSIGYLTELRQLYLSLNSFSGNIPHEFGNLVNLEYLYLEDIGRCSVENITWLSRLSHLKKLGMSRISLAKADHWVNAILSLKNLTTLLLDGCELSQVMHPYSPSSSHVKSSSPSSNIVRLSLSDNSLNSSMYPWLYPLTRSNRLGFLHLSGNKLDQFPKYLGNLCQLTEVYLNNNSAIVPFSDFLKTLSVGCTSIKLRYLNASSSQFTGPISDDILQHFSSLERLDFDHNHLNGTISEKMWELPNLQSIDVSSNSLRGAIFVKTTHLKLNYLDLSKNKFYGGISFLCQNVDGSLTYLDLSHNSFSGRIPDCLSHLKYLKVLNLAHNNLSGRLPASVEYLIQLDALDLYNNNFFGELPSSLRNCTMLTFLDLGANRFSGNVPVWIGENLSGLYVLNLGTNNFFGPIPLQICQLLNLQILDLSLNNLNGTIPSCVNNLTSMVQQGFLSAHKVHTYWIFKTGVSIESRDFIDNAIVQWQGIRREFTNNLGLLKSIDLSSNNLTGQIPNEITDLRALLALNLSNNALFGEIPPKIGKAKELLTLDLSRNHFSGGIPLSISEMTSLDCLDLSYNNLSGRIPSSTQLQSFNASTYTGNAGLCGLPLSKYCPGDEKSPVPSPIVEGDIDELERWFYIGGAIGFAVGFWIVCSTLLLNRRGRYTFFHFMDSLEDWVYVKAVVFKANFRTGGT